MASYQGAGFQREASRSNHDAYIAASHAIGVNVRLCYTVYPNKDRIMRGGLCRQSAMFASRRDAIFEDRQLLMRQAWFISQERR